MLSFVPVAAGVVRLSSLAGGASGGGVTPENARFMAMPAPVVMHIAVSYTHLDVYKRQAAGWS